MIVSRAHRLGEPVLVALGSIAAPEGDLLEGGTLLVAPGLPAGAYIMLGEDGEEVGVLELPDELAVATAWRAVVGEPIEVTRVTEEVERAEE